MDSTTPFTAGYAVATWPIAETAIRTETQGLQAGEVKIPSFDGFEVPGYAARLNTGGRLPIVLVIQEIFGVHEHIKDVCRRLAQEGYYAIAPELYARQGDVSQMQDIQQIIQQVVSKVPDQQVMLDLDATVDYAVQSGQGDAERLGITGFCWGGRVVWLYSAHQPRLKAGAAWYGRLVAAPHANSALNPKQPVDVAGELHGAILGLYGGKDEGIPLATVEQMRAALAAAGKSGTCQIVVYPEAGHAFNADYRPSYHRASALDAWAKMLTWFNTYGVK